MLTAFLIATCVRALLPSGQDPYNQHARFRSAMPIPAAWSMRGNPPRSRRVKEGHCHRCKRRRSPCPPVSVAVQALRKRSQILTRDQRKKLLNVIDARLAQGGVTEEHVISALGELHRMGTEWGVGEAVMRREIERATSQWSIVHRLKLWKASRSKAVTEYVNQIRASANASEKV